MLAMNERLLHTGRNDEWEAGARVWEEGNF